MDCFLGINLGTSRVKAAVFDSEGTCRGSGDAPLSRLNGFPPGRHLHDPRTWWDKALVAVRQALSETAHADSLRGIACCGFHHVPVFLDAAGEPAIPVIMMHDSELSAARERLRQDGRLDAFHKATRSLVSSSHLPSIAEAALSAFPEAWSAIRHVVLAKDYLRYRLTGKIGTEVCDATGTNLTGSGQWDWSAELSASVGIDMDWLPPIAESTDAAGELLPEVAVQLGVPAGVPVFYGGGDSHCALLGLGCIHDGSSAILLGTNCTLRAVFDTPVYDPAIRLWRQRHVVPHHWTVSASSLAGASVIRWARKVLRTDSSSNAACAGNQHLACTSGLYFLPYIHGERCPFLAPEATGSFRGLRAHHTAEDLLQAAKEGVSFTLRMCWEIVNALAEQNAHDLGLPVVSGGGSRDRSWIRLIADVLASPLRYAKGGEAGCLGAAMLAGIGAGIFADHEDAVRRMALRTELIEPSSRRAAQTGPHYLHFRRLAEETTQR